MVHATRPFDVLFLTNFSDSCFRAIPALAQMCDEFDLRLTFLHTYRESRNGMGDLESNLRSFFPEADAYGGCRRVLLPGTPLDGVRQIRSEATVDLVVAPAGDPLGLPRVGHRSLRSQLMSSDGTPMWTIATGTLTRRLLRPARTVACCLEVGRSGRGHLKLACQYARALRASLHVIQILPDIHEGNLLLLATADPFDADCAAAEVYRVAGGDAPEPGVHVTDRPGLADLLTRCEVDVVFLDAACWMHRSWLAPRMNRLAEGLPCPAVYVNADREDVKWQLTRNPSRHVAGEAALLPPLQRAPVRVRSAGGQRISAVVPEWQGRADDAPRPGVQG
ncbi:MAG: hypothetical protein AB7Q29_07855 [Vicinamibacterales bacterium]